MKPSNNKSIYAIVCDNIEELQATEKVSIAKCDAIAKLANAAMNIHMIEMKRVKMLMELEQFNKTNNKITLREVEAKAFDNTIAIE